MWMAVPCTESGVHSRRGDLQLTLYYSPSYVPWGGLCICLAEGAPFSILHNGTYQTWGCLHRASAHGASQARKVVGCHVMVGWLTRALSARRGAEGRSEALSHCCCCLKNVQRESSGSRGKI